jgi:predicted phosphodiesterase
MALIELSALVSIILELGMDFATKKLSRREAIIAILKRINFEALYNATDFEAIYAYTLVEYGVDKPEPILNFFRHKIIIKAFRRALYENNMAMLEKEAEAIIDWNKETGLLGKIDYDPRLEFASFSVVFNQIIDNLRSPTEVKRNQLLEIMHEKLEEVSGELDKFNDLMAVRAELSQRLPIREPEHLEVQEPILIASKPKIIRWLHMSDFHFGKDVYGQRQLFKYILAHIRERVSSGRAPDLVFITGDLANKGQDEEYRGFYNQFFLPLFECLPLDCQQRIFIVPGNHDVDRTQTRAVQTKDILLRIPEFLDPTEQGQFERQVILPRFKAFVENDLNFSGNHWLSSTSGTFQVAVEIQGINVGITGINTAWFSFNDDDRHNLSAGKSLLEDGLEAIKNCDIKFVLGHHPIDWLLDTELEAVRALLASHNALYLHGHMHRGRAKFEEGGGYPFLALQSGAGFQARENDLWVNRFLWCDLNLTTRELNIEPLKWSSEHQNWVTDSDAFPPRYQQGNRWVLPLPVSIPREPIAKREPRAEKNKLEIPEGWNLVDVQYLKDRGKQLNFEQAISFFDGRAPIWREALTPQIPRREIVNKIVHDLELSRQEGGLRVTLLMGPAGEGKTTALLQIVCDLVNSKADWHVLWHHDPSTPLSAESIARLPDTGTWLIVSDDAEVIARRVFDSVQALRLTGKKNVQFLLCCRDTDWRAAEVEDLPWDQHTKFITEVLHGLTRNDAEKIISAWAAYGNEGLKTLDGIQPDDATTQLLSAAKSEEVNTGEGSFFGAILQVRWGKGLKEHIYSLLKNLEKKTVSSGKTLLDAFAYIAAMHAEDLQVLSKDVLAGVLGIPIQELKKKVLGPLGEEAAIATTAHMVFTRHRAIANITLKILSEKFDIDSSNLYFELIEEVNQAFNEKRYFIPRMGTWNYLSSHFFNKGEKALGIRLAQLMHDISPQNAYFIVNLANLYRQAEQPQQGIKVFRSAPSKILRYERPYFSEWGTVEGNYGNYAIGVCLTAFSLSDQASRRPPDNENARIALTGISLAFAELYGRYNRFVFAEACGAVVQLGLIVEKDPKMVPLFLRNQSCAKGAGVEDVPPNIALEHFQVGIRAAWEMREEELCLPVAITSIDELTFNGLARLLQIS